MRQRASTEPVPGVQSEIGNGAIVAEELKLGKEDWVRSRWVYYTTRPRPPSFFHSSASIAPFAVVLCQFQLNALNRLATISLVLRPFTAKPLLRFSYNYTVKSGYEIKLLLKDLKPRDWPSHLYLVPKEILLSWWFSIFGLSEMFFASCHSLLFFLFCCLFFRAELIDAARSPLPGAFIFHTYPLSQPCPVSFNFQKHLPRDFSRVFT